MKKIILGTLLIVISIVQITAQETLTGLRQNPVIAKEAQKVLRHATIHREAIKLPFVEDFSDYIG
ncbi:MAG: hypothetical protein RR034_08775, partial [Bacteroidales bacterium]